jgi:hypothetical protein
MASATVLMVKHGELSLGIIRYVVYVLPLLSVSYPLPVQEIVFMAMDVL